MPQMDTAAFLPQVFWLVVIFTGFYLIVLTQLLPRMSRILKVRAKKLSQGKEIFHTMKNEENSVEVEFSRIISNTSKDSSLLLSKAGTASQAWVENSLQNIAGQKASGPMKETNDLYMKNIQKTSADQSLLVKLTAFL